MFSFTDNSINSTGVRHEPKHRGSTVTPLWALWIIASIPPLLLSLPELHWLPTSSINTPESIPTLESQPATCSFSGCLQFYLIRHLITNVSEFSEALRREAWYLQRNFCQSPLTGPLGSISEPQEEKVAAIQPVVRKEEIAPLTRCGHVCFFRSKCVTGNFAVHLCKSFAYTIYVWARWRLFVLRN